MRLPMSRRPRRGDDEEVSNHRRSRGLLAAGGHLVKVSLHKLGRPLIVECLPPTREVLTNVIPNADSCATASRREEAARVLTLL